MKALVALTARDELLLRHDLAQLTAQLPIPTEFAVNSVPAEVIAQRPDIDSAAHDVAAASFDSVSVNARRWPRISLAGNISASRASSLNVTSDGTSWSIGPIAITIPLFNDSSWQANSAAAKVRYETAATIYAARLRTAIKEVEEALVTLDSTSRRSENVRVSIDGFERAYQGTATSYEIGVASLLDLEEARRNLATSKNLLIELRRERLLAWISLYRALGGGWSPQQKKDSDAL